VSFRDNFAVLQDANFRWFYASNVVNQAGNAMASVALVFSVLQIDDSTQAVGLVMASETIPMVTFMLVGGVIADRFNRALVLRITRWSAAVLQSVAAFLIISDRAEIWMLMVLEALFGITSAMAFPAMQGLVPELAGREHLQQANALGSMSRGLFTVIGPSIAALLVAGVGGGWALAGDAVSWFLAGLLLAFVRIPAKAGTGEPRPGMIAELREGWTLFRTTTWFWVVVAAFMVLNAVHSGAMGVVAPYVAKHTIGVRDWGFALSAESVGALGIALFLLRIKVSFPLRVFMLSCIPFGLPMLLLGIHPNAVVMVVAMAASGACLELGGLCWNLAMQENIPAEMMSRAYSYDALGSFVAMPVGQLLFAPLGGLVGNRHLLVGSGVFYQCLLLVTLAVPAVFTLRRADPAAEPAAA